MDVTAGVVNLRNVLRQGSLHVLDRFDRGIDLAWVISRSASDLKALIALVLFKCPDPPRQLL